MSEDRKPRPADDSGATEPAPSGPEPKSGEANGENDSSRGAPYDKKPDPARQPS